jgi:hypothetical protein
MEKENMLSRDYKVSVRIQKISFRIKFTLHATTVNVLCVSKYTIGF